MKNQKVFKLKLDPNATGALNNLMFKKTNSCSYFIFEDIDEIKKLNVMWRNGQTVEELSDNETLLKQHEGTEKLMKVEMVATSVKKNIYTDTTVFGIRKNNTSPIVITDGIHRVIGIFKAISKDPSIKNKICLRILLCESPNFNQLEDYNMSIINKR